MYTYAVDGPIKTRDKPTPEPGKDTKRPARGAAGGPIAEGSNYTVMSFSLPDSEITWCFGPGISTIFITKNESPRDVCVVSRRPSA
jgi:hypothetical protein